MEVVLFQKTYSENQVQDRWKRKKMWVSGDHLGAISII